LKETTHKATHEDDLGKLRWLDTHWRGWALDRLTRQEIQRIGALKAAESSPATANRYLALVRAILIRAQRIWEWIDHAPAITLYPTRLPTTYPSPAYTARPASNTRANALTFCIPSQITLGPG
jgi:hypothetical protein